MGNKQSIVAACMLLGTLSGCSGFKATPGGPPPQISNAPVARAAVQLPALTAAQPKLTPVQMGIADGTPYFFTMDIKAGTLVTGKTYLFRHDSKTGSDTVSSISDYRSISAYKSPDAANGKFTLWGVDVKVGADARGPCFVQANGVCAAHILATPFGTQASLAVTKRDRDYLAYMDYWVSTLAGQRILTRDTRLLVECLSTGCPEIADKDSLFYYVGTEFELMAGILPFVSNADQYKAVADDLDAAFGYVRGFLTAYVASETPTFATWASSFAHGLVSYSNLSKRADVQSYIRELTTPALLNVFMQEFTDGLHLPDYILTDTSLRSIPTFRVEFLQVANPRQLAGVETYSTYDSGFVTAGISKMLFNWTALGDTPVVCVDTRNPEAPPQPMILGYGAAPHMAAGDDCEQDSHTYGNIIEGVHVYQYLKSVCPSAGPGSPWYNICINIGSVLLANLAWIDSMQVGDGGSMYAKFPGTVRIGTTNNSDPVNAAIGSKYFWIVYQEISFVPDSTPVKVDYSGRTKPLSAMIAAAQMTSDYMVRIGATPIWLGEYIRAQGIRNRVAVPDTNNR